MGTKRRVRREGLLKEIGYCKRRIQVLRKSVADLRRNIADYQTQISDKRRQLALLRK